VRNQPVIFFGEDFWEKSGKTGVSLGKCWVEPWRKEEHFMGQLWDNYGMWENGAEPRNNLL